LEEDVLQRNALAVFRTSQSREFPGEQTVRFLLWRYSKYAEHHEYCFAHFPVVKVRVATLLIHLHKNLPNILPVFFFRREKSNTARAKTALREILLQEEIQG
jgi:hypothetical protein